MNTKKIAPIALALLLISGVGVAQLASSDTSEDASSAQSVQGAVDTKPTEAAQAETTPETQGEETSTVAPAQASQPATTAPQSQPTASQSTTSQPAANQPAPTENPSSNGTSVSPEPVRNDGLDANNDVLDDVNVEPIDDGPVLNESPSRGGLR